MGSPTNPDDAGPAYFPILAELQSTPRETGGSGRVGSLARSMLPSP